MESFRAHSIVHVHPRAQATSEVQDKLLQLNGSKLTFPACFVKGIFVGGCNDGGLGGVVPTLRSGQFQALLG